ncbi:YheC/YheD family protein [Metabacillus sp. RGM 3146]|uniref:YheC/YheD family endospore coat-associated protein n=1 Tax=Metabacillus sp. RGM 3146 TaxID=3401092 RepID=UPI003B9A4285
MSQTLGYMTVNPEHELAYSTEIGKRSKALGFTLFRFCPLDIDPASLLINGQKFNPVTESFEEASMPLPPFIYDRCFYGKGSRSSKSKPIVEWLKKNPHTTFLGKGLPTKWEVYEFLSRHKTLSFYMPQTVKINHFEQISLFLFKERSCLLKPAAGSQARGIMAIRIQGRKIELVYHSGKNKKSKEFHTMAEFEKWFTEYLKQSKLTYLMQPLLSLQNKRGYPFDIRTLLQKDEAGNWCVRGKGIRSGYHGSFVSNLGSGGESSTFEEWISTFSKKERFLIEDELATILKALPEALETAFPSLFEIGLDIGFSRNGSLWILDVNSKPGHKLILQAVPEQTEILYRAPLAYCAFLLNKQSQKKGSPVE